MKRQNEENKKNIQEQSLEETLKPHIRDYQDVCCNNSPDQLAFNPTCFI